MRLVQKNLQNQITESYENNHDDYSSPTDGVIAKIIERRRIKRGCSRLVNTAKITDMDVGCYNGPSESFGGEFASGQYFVREVIFINGFWYYK